MSDSVPPNNVVPFKTMQRPGLHAVGFWSTLECHAIAKDFDHRDYLTLHKVSAAGYTPVSRAVYSKLCEAFNIAMAEDNAPPDPTLKSFGYAPGNYMGICHSCKNRMYDVDKRASTCLSCATERLNAALASNASTTCTDSPTTQG